MDEPTQQPISDDQELAKVLAGVSEVADESEAAGTGVTPAVPTLPPLPTPPVAAPAAPVAAPAPVVSPAELSAASDAAAKATSDSALDGVKKEAISELRPLVDKLNVAPEEKFDTYLLLIRSTDDKSLIAPAHAVAQAIQDETRRAQALLDIIKEIDYLNNPQQ